MDSHIHIFKLNFIQKTSRLWCPNYMINSKVNTHYKVFILRVLCLLIMCQTIPQGDQHISQNDMITKQLCCLCHWPKCEHNEGSSDFSFPNPILAICLNFQEQNPFQNQYLPPLSSEDCEINSIKFDSSRALQYHQECLQISIQFSVLILFNFHLKKWFNN